MSQAGNRSLLSRVLDIRVPVCLRGLVVSARLRLAPLAVLSLGQLYKTVKPLLSLALVVRAARAGLALDTRLR